MFDIKESVYSHGSRLYCWQRVLANILATRVQLRRLLNYYTFPSNKCFFKTFGFFNRKVLWNITQKYIKDSQPVCNNYQSNANTSHPPGCHAHDI